MRNVACLVVVDGEVVDFVVDIAGVVPETRQRQLERVISYHYLFLSSLSFPEFLLVCPFCPSQSFSTSLSLPFLLSSCLFPSIAYPSYSLFPSSSFFSPILFPPSASLPPHFILLSLLPFSFFPSRSHPLIPSLLWKGQGGYGHLCNSELAMHSFFF